MYETGPGRPYKPVVRNIRLENVRSTNSPRVMWIASFPGAVVDGVSSFHKEGDENSSLWLITDPHATFQILPARVTLQWFQQRFKF